MARISFVLASLALFGYVIQPAVASNAESFFAYMREVAVPAQPESEEQNSRQSRQTCNGPLCVTFSFNGATNFTFNIAQIPTTFPISCGGDPRNYCNYPDLPLLETYDLDYYSRRPIPSGRCPNGYTKMPTFDCLNIAPALFETTCCVFLGTSVPDVCSSTFTIDSMFTLCNGSVYITSGAYAWRLDQNFNLVQGPIMLAALTGGAISRDLAEAEVDGNCNVQFFNMMDQYTVVNFADGSLSSSGLSLVSNLCLSGTPNAVYGTGNRGSNIYKIAGAGFQMVANDGYDFIIGQNVTCAVGVRPPGCLNLSPRLNATSATYLPSRDLIVHYIREAGVNNLYFSTRNGATCTGPTVLNLCPSAAAAPTSQVAPIVYIPYPIYPVFTQGQAQVQQVQGQVLQGQVQQGQVIQGQVQQGQGQAVIVG